MLSARQIIRLGLACFWVLLGPSAAAAADSDSNAKIPAGSYQHTCVLIDMHGDALRAICQAMNGDWLASELPNYDACGAGISNQNGKLTCNGIKPRPAGTYVASCDEVSVRSDTLMARCKTVKQKMLWTSLKDFRKCKGDITNIDGHLKCEQMTSLEMGGAGLEGFQGLDQALSPDVAKTFANWQLQHDTWTFKDGAPENVVALAQTNDGLLWLGGPSGLYRFDGRQFEFFRSAFGEELLSTDISSLYAPATGGLWIGYLFGGTSF